MPLRLRSCATRLNATPPILTWATFSSRTVLRRAFFCPTFWDAIVDIVETGTTLKENGLVVKEEVCPVSARLIVNIASMKLRKKEIEELIDKIEKDIKKRAKEA